MEIKERMQAVLAAEARAIAQIDVDEQFVRAVRTMAACQGKVLTTGIGKAGHIARKFAATLCSTATPADFIHPAEAAHGDLGLVGQNDVLIAFSTSGKSREVLEILELARHLGVATIIGVTSIPTRSCAGTRRLRPRGACARACARGHIIEEHFPGLTPSATGC